MLLFAFYRKHQFKSTVQASEWSGGRSKYTKGKTGHKIFDEGQRLTSMLDEFQEIRSALSELRLDCCEWLAGRIPELSILMDLGLVCADAHIKNGWPVLPRGTQRVCSPAM